MRPVHPKMDGALYRPTTPAACGTATAADDSLGYGLIKVAKGQEFQSRVIHRLHRRIQSV